MKRVFDVVVSTIIFIVLFPLFILIGFLILILQGKPILFRQNRLGKHHRPLKIIKFCTMTNDVDSTGNLLPDIERTTKLGDFLRRSSLDELPGLFNVLSGEMSLIGPRPLPVIYKSRYSMKQDRRHEVKPGITGWAQINGRNAIPWEEKFELDVWYVDHQSLKLDLKILLLTVDRVVSKKDIIPSDKDAMEEFLGTK